MKLLGNTPLSRCIQLIIISGLVIAGLTTAISLPFVQVHAAQTTSVSIQGTNFLINGQVTYPGTSVQGDLLNSRMIQGLFDDENSQTAKLWAYPDTHVWDAQRNTNELIAALPSYAQHGLRMITVGLQGGCPVCGSPN